MQAFREASVEAELFGCERGSFAGISAAMAGWFEAAHGGTLFLDEVGDLSPSVQRQLLTVLQSKQVVRLGSRQATSVRVRLVVASNVSLADAVAAGRFNAEPG